MYSVDACLIQIGRSYLLYIIKLGLDKFALDIYNRLYKSQHDPLWLDIRVRRARQCKHK